MYQWNLPLDGRIGDSVDIIPHPCNTHLAHMFTRALYQCGDISASSSSTCTNHKSALQVLANQMSDVTMNSSPSLHLQAWRQGQAFTIPLK